MDWSLKKMTAITNTTGTVRISNEHNMKLNHYAKLSRKDKKEVAELLIDWIPVYDYCEKNGITIEQALARLEVAPINVPRSSKNRDEFATWLEKIMTHNEQAQPSERVFITQRLFLNIIGGNVNTLSSAYRLHEKQIEEHNAKLKIDPSANRSLSHKVREQYGTVADWLKAILS